jgi:Domain of unknown function (DUF4214)
MPRTSRIALRLAVGALALLTTMGVLPASPAPAEEIVEPVRSATTLAVAPGDRTEPGVQLTLTATVVEADTGKPITGEVLHFAMDDQPLASVDLDEGGRAQVTVTPPQGAHVIEALFTQGEDDIFAPSWDLVRQSVLPATCVEEARFGPGSVVRHAYMVSLRRCPDAAGYAYWVERLGGDVVLPGTTAVMARALALSAERIAATVDDAYRRVLGRPADPAGRQVWAAKLRAGWTTSQLWAALAASPEFAAGTAGPGALVERAFTRIVGRPADSAGAAYWQARLASGPPSATWRALSVTTEVVDGLIADGYRSALGRPASLAEVDVARTAIRTRRGDWRLLVAELLGLPEAYTHAQRYPEFGDG